MLRILVVEDTPKHLEDAIRVGQELGVEVVTRTTFGQALRFLKMGDEGTVDGVISDLFIPHSDNPLNADEGHAGFLVPDQPRGLGIMAIAEAMDIPHVLCTSEHHHADKLQWITDVVRFVSKKKFEAVKKLGADPKPEDCASIWNFVEGETEGQKNWGGAFHSILLKIERRLQNEK